nr:transposase, Ptta/En/Spm [Tanacetum cinerariifolium]
MRCPNVGRGGRSGRGGGRGLSDHEAARGWGQISIRTNTSGTRSETNATITSDTGVQKSIWTNTSGTRYETNATISFDTRVQKTIRTNTSGTRSETNTWVQKSIGTNTSGTHSEINTGTTWKEVDKSGCHELWAYFKELFKWEGLSDVLVHDAWENSMKKRYPDIMSKARVELVKLEKAVDVQFKGVDCTILKPYNPGWIKSKHWEDMIDRVYKTKNWLNKATSDSKNRMTVKEGFIQWCSWGKYGLNLTNHPIYDDLWKQCAGDDKKGGAFGWGSMSDPQYTLTGTPSTTRCTGALSGSKDEELKEEMKVDLKEEIKADLKEEMKADLKEEIKNDLKEEMRRELKEEIREELKEEMRANFLDMLVDYGINSRVTRQTKTKQAMKEQQNGWLIIRNGLVTASSLLLAT